MTSGSLWNYFRGEIETVDDDASESKSMKDKVKIIVKAQAQTHLYDQYLQKEEINHHNHQ